MLLPSVTLFRGAKDWSFELMVVVVQSESVSCVHVGPVKPFTQMQLHDVAVVMLVPPLAHGVLC